MIEQTLSIIKPDAVERNLDDKIKSFFEKNDIKILKSNDKYSGCTVHYVNSKLDSGKIILQKKILIDKFETADSLRRKILIQEHKLYPQSIISVFR